MAYSVIPQYTHLSGEGAIEEVVVNDGQGNNIVPDDILEFKSDDGNEWRRQELERYPKSSPTDIGVNRISVHHSSQGVRYRPNVARTR